MLYIAEKPELAKAIVEGLGGGSKKKGYFDCGQDIVTWCHGHMLRLVEPEEYDASYKQWDIAKLPFCFFPWKKAPIAKSKDQLTIILGLLKKADIVVNAGDPDSEGQLLVDEILEYARFKKPVKRVLINDNTTVLVKKALANLRDNAEFAGLSAAAKARQIGDKAYGYNLTRLYTLVARREGYPDMLSVGRVQTPILGLVVRRDREHAGHQKSFYYTVEAGFDVDGKTFTATYKPAPGDPVDEKGRLNDAEAARSLADSLAGKTALVKSLDTVKGETPPPLPYNLLKLQSDASRQFGLLPDQVKEITQCLREKHRLITYNRSDCQYLSDEQHADGPGVIASIETNIPGLDLYVAMTDPAIKSRAFNSSKVSAHHAIVPTQSRVDFSGLSENERRIYELIAKTYLVQFMPAHTWEKTSLELEVDGAVFTASSRSTLDKGWRSVHSLGDKDEEDDSEGFPVEAGAEIRVASGTCLEKETKPKALYTMATLLEDLTRVAQYVQNENLRKALVEKDKGKSGEHGGIGTPATRDEIIKTLFERGFIETRKKGSTVNVVSTKVGQEFYDILPDSARYPDLTSVWHEQQMEIERGELEVDSFVNDVVYKLSAEVKRISETALDSMSKSTPVRYAKVLWFAGPASTARSGVVPPFRSAERPFPTITAGLLPKTIFSPPSIHPSFVPPAERRWCFTIIPRDSSSRAAVFPSVRRSIRPSTANPSTTRINQSLPIFTSVPSAGKVSCVVQTGRVAIFGAARDFPSVARHFPIRTIRPTTTKPKGDNQIDALGVYRKESNDKRH